MFLAQLMGAAIYTDQQVTKHDLVSAQNPSAVAPGGTERTALEHALRLKLTVDSDANATLTRRDSSPSQAFRSAIGELWKAAISQGEHSSQAAVSDAIREVERVSNAALVEGADAQIEDTCAAVFDIDATIIVPPDGYGLNAARRFLIAFGRRKHIQAVPLAILFGQAARPLQSEGRST